MDSEEKRLRYDINKRGIKAEVSLDSKSPLIPAFRTELTTKTNEIQSAIAMIRRYDSKLADELEKELKDRTTIILNSDEQITHYANLDDLYKAVLEKYQNIVMKKKLKNAISSCKKRFENDFSNTTIKDIVDRVSGIREEINKFNEQDDDVSELSQKFAELKVLCIAMYYRKKDGNIQNDEIFKEFVGNSNEKYCLNIYILSMHFEKDRDYNREINYILVQKLK